MQLLFGNRGPVDAWQQFVLKWVLCVASCVVGLPPAAVGPVLTNNNCINCTTALHDELNPHPI
jgi:hypothetical protein